MEDNKLCLEKQPLNQEMLDKIDAYWRAANYLSAGQLYLLDNPLLREPLTMDQIKKKIVGHWGTVPGQAISAFLILSPSNEAANPTGIGISVIFIFICLASNEVSTNLS